MPAASACSSPEPAPMGGSCCQEGVLVWPGDFRLVGLGGLFWWLSSQLPGSCRRVVRGPAGAPAACAPGRARARTNELDAGERRPMIGSEEEPAGCGVAGLGPVAGSPGCVVGGVVSHAPIRHLPGWAGAMTVTSGGRAAQSGHRARQGRLMRFCELARGWRPLPGL